MTLRLGLAALLFFAAASAAARGDGEGGPRARRRAELRLDRREPDEPGHLRAGGSPARRHHEGHGRDRRRHAAPRRAPVRAPMSAGKVFLDYDQAALDRAYDQTQWAPNQQEVIARRAAAGDAVRARLGEPRRVAYGPAPIEQ